MLARRLLAQAHGSTRPRSVWSYVDESKAEVNPLVSELFHGIVAGQRAALARGITLVESINSNKKSLGELHTMRSPPPHRRAST